MASKLAAVMVLAACGGGTGGAVDANGDDASVDGATGDGATGDTAAVALCERSGLLFCEDFEALPIGAANNSTSAAWDTEAANGQLSIDATHARGQRALKVATTANGRGRLTVAGLAPTGNSLYGTMHAWVSGFPTAPDYAHYTMVELTGTGNTTALRPIGGQYAPAQGLNPAGGFWGVGSDGGPTGDWTNWKRTAPSLGGQWVCLEFRMSSANSEIDVWLDGVAKPEMSVTKTSHGGTQVDLVFPTLERAWFGWWLYQSGPTPNTYDVWLDDIALGDSRLGCD